MADKMMEFIRLDDLKRRLMYVGWDKHNLQYIQPLRDEIAAKLEVVKAEMKGEPNNATA